MDRTEMEKREWQDLFDSSGEVIGKQQRGDRVPDGAFTKLVSIFTFNNRGEVLLTKRAETKTFGLLWENTAGACLSGETQREGALRELREETGICAKDEELIELGRFETPSRHAWMYGFFVNKEIPIEQIVLQPGETIDAKWVPFDIGLTYDDGLAWPVRYRFVYFWKQLETYFHAENHLSPWLDWAQNLQFWAQQGQAYTKSRFDKDRYDHISKTASEMLAYKTGISTEKVLGLFASEKGYQTPKIECRAAVFHEDRILLVQEASNYLWSMPGGWCDIGISLKENLEKEVFEEAGLKGKAGKLVAIENRSYHQYKPIPYEIYKCYMICHVDQIGPIKEGIEQVPGFQGNLETLGAAFFPLDRLPPLSTGRVNEEAIRMSYEASKDPNWIPRVD